MKQTTNEYTKIVFIGGGNMAQAIIGGMLSHGFSANQISVIEPHSETQNKLSKIGKITVLTKANDELTQADLIVWAVKPQILKSVIEQNFSLLSNKTLHLSIAAGVLSSTLARWLNSHSIVRVMPNTPALIAQGSSGLFAGATVSKMQRDLASQIMNSCSQTLWVEKEDLLDAVTAVSGSGPAYVFYCLNAMAQTGVKLGLSDTQAQQLASQTFIGAASLAQQSQLSFQQLQDNVTSKGGTTFAALSVFEQQNMAEIWQDAMLACYHRAQQLANENNN